MAVAGLGAFGAAAAAALARRGLATVALDRYRPPHRLGSSHGGSRIIRRVYAEGAIYGDLVERSYSGWRELEQVTGAGLLIQSGGLTIGSEGGSLVAGALDSARRNGLRHELLDARELARRFAGFRPPAGHVGVWDPQAGLLRLEPALEALLAQASAAGADLRYDCPLITWEPRGSGLALETTRGELFAHRLVLAVGAWSGQLLPAGAPPLAVTRQVQHWFRPAGSGCGPSELPVWVWQLDGRPDGRADGEVELDDGQIWYGLPDLGEGVKAALHHGGRGADVETVERAVAASEIEAVRRLLARYLPAAEGAWRRSAVCLYTNTADLRFAAGPLTAYPGVWLLAGGSGHGFKFAPGLAELVAEGVAADAPPAALQPFLPDRPDASAGTPVG